MTNNGLWLISRWWSPLTKPLIKLNPTNLFRSATSPNEKMIWDNDKRSSDVEDLIHVLEDFRVCQKVLPVSSGRRKWTKVHQSTIRNLPTLDFQLEGKILSNFRRPFLGSAVNSKKCDFAPISNWTPYSEKNLYKLVKMFSNIWALFWR